VTPADSTGGETLDGTSGSTTATEDTTTDTTADSSSESGEELCGNDVREDDEECDEGDRNADDWNCMADCTINPLQQLVIDQDEASDQADAMRNSKFSFVGDGSWCNAPGQDLNRDGFDKLEIYWDPEEEVPIRDDDDPYFYNWGPTMVSEIADAQYSTYRPAEQNGQDFYALMYTVADGRDDTGAFYGYRMTAVTSRALRLDHNVEQWDTFRMSAPEGDEPNTMTFYDTEFTNSFDGQPTAADLVGTTRFDWTDWNPAATATSIDYGAEMVRFVSVQTASNWDTFEGCLDGLTIWHTDGRQLTIDLE